MGAAVERIEGFYRWLLVLPFGACPFTFLFEGNDEKEKGRYFSTVFSGPMRSLSLSIFSIIAAPNCYRPVGKNSSPQGCESVAPPKGNESDPSRPAGGRLAWSLWLRGPQASHPRKNAPPKGPPQPEKGVSGEEPLPPSGGPGGSAPWCSFPCFLQRKQAPPRAVAPRRWHLQHPLPMVGKSLP